MAMDKSAADAFVYAKASGMLARSYVGERAVQLFAIHSLGELWSFLFKKEVPAVPETLLAKALEVEAQNLFLSQYKALIRNYSRPAPILVALLHFYDYDNLKEIGAALCFNEREMPAISDTAPFSLINYAKWPDIQAMTAGGGLAWYNKVPSIRDQQQNDYRMDCQYIEEIWEAAKRSNPACREAVLKLVGERFRMDNILWGLRLRIYYQMEKAEILEHLAYSTENHDPKGPLVAEAIKMLDWELDNWEQWKKWKYAALLNPHEEGLVWTVDPRWIFNAYQRVYVQKAYRLFHQFPFTECPLVCWFLIKRHELDNIRTASEGLRLHVDAEQAMQLAGVSEVKNG